MLWASLTGGRTIVVDSAAVIAGGTAVAGIIGGFVAWRKVGVELAKIQFDAENARRDDMARERQNQISLENIKLAATKLATDAHQQDQERKFRAEQAELARKTADHNFENRFNALGLIHQESEIDLREARSEIETLKRQLEAHAASIRANAKATVENKATIADAKTEIGRLSSSGDSGSFPKASA